MRIGPGLLIGVGAIVTMAIALPMVAFSFSIPGPKKDAMMGGNFFAIRREALTLFPRGSQIKDAAAGLTGIGFQCIAVPHKVPNVNAESLACASHGRGFPGSPAVNITVIGRNGVLSDFEVWNMLEEANFETPEPPPPATPVPAAGPEAPGGKPAHGE